MTFEICRNFTVTLDSYVSMKVNTRRLTADWYISIAGKWKHSSIYKIYVYVRTLCPIYHSSRTLIDSQPSSRKRTQCHSWMNWNEVTTLSHRQLTTENTLQTGRGILVNQFALQKSGRGNEGAIVFEMRLHTKILTTIRLVDRLAWVASDGVSYIDIENM